METLLKITTAYKIFSGDIRCGKVSHAYMLRFQDAKNLRSALKLFALEFFGTDAFHPLGQRILNESYTDLKVYPQDGKKFTVDAAGEIVADSAMRPVEGAKKLYIISGFEQAGALVQNKLLKTLEEPLAGVYFLLGACSLAPVLDTVKSRVKILEIPPFSEDDIFAALERKGKNPLNASAAKSANGVLGAAENMAEGGWFQSLEKAAEEICCVKDAGKIGEIAAKYGDAKYKEELLAEMQRLYFAALKGENSPAAVYRKPALAYAVERVNGALAEVKLNAYFQGLLYDFMLSVIQFDRRAAKTEGEVRNFKNR